MPALIPRAPRWRTRGATQAPAPASVAGDALVASGVVVWSAATALVMMRPGSSIAAPVIAVFWLAAPGMLHAVRARGPLTVRIATVPLIGTTLLVGVGLAQVWLGLWHPRAVTYAVVLATGLVAAVRLWSARSGLVGLRGRIGRPLPRRPTRWAVIWWGSASTALAWWAWGLRTLAAADHHPGGLLTVSPYGIAGPLAMSAVLFAIAVAQARWWRALCALGLAWLALRVTGPLITEVPIYAWTYKHVGVGELIVSAASLPAESDIYFAWPGLFAAAAALGQTSDTSLLELARWTTPVVHLITMAVVAGLARSIGLNARQIMVAVFVFEVGSWVGQDYFAPQAIALYLALGVIMLALRAGTDRAAAGWAVAVFAVLVPTHQLTPFWALAAVGALAFFGRLPWRVVWPMAAWALAYMALHWQIVDQYGVVSSGSPLDNAGPATEAVDTTSERASAQRWYQLVALAWWAPAVVLAVLGIARRRKEVFTAAVVAFSPFALLVAQSYGGEATLRVYLYASAGMAMLVAPPLASLLEPRADRARHWVWARVGACAALVAIWALFAAQAYFAPWFANRMSAAQIRVTETLAAQVPGPAYLSSGRGLWPHRADPQYFARSIERWDYDRSLWGLRPAGPIVDGEETLGEIEEYLDAGDAVTFVMFAEQSELEARFDGVAEEDGYRALRAAVTASPRWESVLVDSDVEVFRYVPPAAADSEAALWQPSA